MSSSGLSASNATSFGPVSKLPTSFLIIHFLAALYMPFVILFFYQRLHYPSIRQGNPILIMLLGILCAMYCLTESGMLLFYKIIPVSSGLYTLFTTLVLLLTMFTIFVSDSILVLDYIFNRLLVEIHRYPQNKEANTIKCKRILRLLSINRTHWIAASYLVFCLPVVLWVCTSSDSSMWTLEGSWDNTITTKVRNTCIIQCAMLLIGTSVHGYAVGAEVRNSFILRKAYHLTQRLLATCFLIYLIVAVIVPAQEALLRLALGTTIIHIAMHAVFIVHLVIPLVLSRNEVCLQFYTPAFSNKDSWEAQHAELLSLFLATSGGFTQYTLFAQVHLLPVLWVLAYYDITQHTLIPQALYNLYIRRDSIMCISKTFPVAMLAELDMTFQRNVITSASKDLYEMFDPLTKLLLQLLVIETFPQFQNHPLGSIWTSFIEHCSDEVSAPKLPGAAARRPLNTIHSGISYVSTRSSQKHSRYSTRVTSDMS